VTNFLDRLLGRGDTTPARKAVTGPGVLAYNNPSISSVLGGSYEQRAAAYLRAYKVGWFYKAGARISRDLANLAWTLSYEDLEGDNEEEIVAPANDVPFERLDPLEQFLRLSERPNPYQTGRALKQKQAIRQIFAGRALWYLEGGEGGDLPTALYGISPARMSKSYDKRTGVHIGWVMDADSRNPVPFSRDEIVVVEEEGPEEDPQGVVEAVWEQVVLAGALPRHVSDVLATGGRMAGMITPKERTLDEAEFQDALRAWRSVTSDPNAARRLLLFPEPMEYTSAAATPDQIGIPELAMLSRDDILTAFPIAPEMLMVPMASGLNSGETQVRVEERYWSGSIHPRVEMVEDAFQQQLIPRYEAAMGRPLDFDISEPNLDDAPAIVEKVGAYRGLVAIGMDPKDAIEKVGLAYIKWNGLPDLLDPAKQAQAAAEAREAGAEAASDGLRVVATDSTTRDASSTQQTVVGKAVSRDATLDREYPGLRATIATFLEEQRERTMAKVAKVLPAKTRIKAVPDGWWDAAAEDALLTERLRTVYISIGTDALQVAATNTGRIIAAKAVDRVIAEILARSGLRITDINETTRKSIAETLEIGVGRGYSIPQLVNGVPREAFGGVQGALTANGVQVWDNYRAEVIARTETMNAYNEAALLGYKTLAVRQVQAIDGDTDADCAARNGAVYSVDDALGIGDHPNGTLDWVPITKAHDEDRTVVDFAEAIKAIAERPIHLTVNGSPVSVTTPEQTFTVNVPDQAPPVVNVSTPETIVNLPAPQVTVKAGDVFVPQQDAPVVNVTVPEQAAPVVNVEAPNVTVKAGDVIVPTPVVQNTVNVPEQHITVKSTGEMRITEMPTRLTTRKVTGRTKDGISEVTDVETDA
jgi:hypothetical protein